MRQSGERRNDNCLAVAHGMGKDHMAQEWSLRALVHPPVRHSRLGGIGARSAIRENGAMATARRDSTVIRTASYPYRNAEYFTDQKW